MSTRFLPAALLLIASAYGQSQDPEPAHLLRYRFAPKTDAHYSIEEGIKSVATINGQEMVTNAIMTTFASATVKKAPDGSARLEQRITRITAKVSGQASIEYDSQDPKADPAQIGAPADIIGARFAMTISDRGAASDFAVPKALQQSMSDEDVGKRIARDLIRLPEQAIAIGASWQSKQPMPLGPLGSPEATITNTLVAVTEQSIELRQDFAVDLSKLTVGIPVESVKAQANVKLDRRTGLLTDMTMRATIKIGGEMAPTLVITRAIKPAPGQVPAVAEKPAK